MTLRAGTTAKPVALGNARLRIARVTDANVPVAVAYPARGIHLPLCRSVSTRVCQRTGY